MYLVLNDKLVNHTLYYTYLRVIFVITLITDEKSDV